MRLRGWYKTWYESRICNRRRELTYGICLLYPLLLSVAPDQGVENGKHVTPVFNHAEKNVAQFRLSLGLPVPLGQNGWRDLDISPKLFRRVTPQEEPIEKGRLPLRKLEVLGNFDGNELCHRGHKGKCSLPKSVSASSSTADLMQRARQCPFGTGQWFHIAPISYNVGVVS